MRAVILTCNTGGGHNSAAASLQEAFRKEGWTCDTTDALQFISKQVTQLMSSGHNWVYRHAPGVFNLGYQFAEQHQDLFQEDSRIVIYDSILLAVRVEDIKRVSDMIALYRKGGTSNEDTEESTVD